MVKRRYIVWRIFISVLIQIIGLHPVVHTKTKVVNDTTIVFQNCFALDLRNLREFHNNPIHVQINNCHLPELPNAIFVKFPGLRSLEIFESRLTHVHDYALNGLNRLETLALRQNNLTALKSWSDHDLLSLQSLDLRRNFIHEIKENALKRYPNLTRLNLAVNLIKHVESGAFKHVTHLKYLNFGKNMITTIADDTFKGLHKLTHLSLHHNQIDFVDFYAFTGQTHLKSLQLQGNKITLFEAEYVENLPRLAFLNVSHNLIDKIGEEAFRKNAELKMLDMSYNLIENIPEKALLGLQSLESLNISHNSLTILNNYILEDLMELKYFDISSNNLTTILDNLFESTKRLVYVNISGNKIEDIETNAFKELNLHSIDLSYNKLSNDGFLWFITSLQYLNLSHNNYKRINLSILKNLQYAEMYDNPWDCQWLVHELVYTSSEGAIGFGRSYIVPQRQGILRVPGIQCFDIDGSEKRLIVLDTEKAKEELIKSQEVIKHTNSFSKLSSFGNFRTEIDDLKDSYNPFDFTSIIMWLAIAVFVVFGAVKILRVLMKRSEMTSEEWRQSSQLQQQVDLLPQQNENKNEIRTNKSESIEKTEVIAKIP